MAFRPGIGALIVGLALFCQSGSAQELLPLAPGNSWRLSSGSVQATLSVTAFNVVNGVPRATLRFENPWFSYGLIVRETADGVLLEGVQYDTGLNGYPEPVVLFGNGQNGQTWSSAPVTSTLASANNTIVTSAGTFRNVSRFDVMFSGDTQTWYLAPSVGFVQFGTGAGLRLSSFTLNAAGDAATTADADCPKVGITANPRATDEFSAAGKEQAFRAAVDGGSNFMTIAATWSDLEPSPGVYDFSSVAQQLALAGKYGVDAVFTIKTIDTLARPVPSDLASLNWDDPVLLSRWTDFLRALVPALNEKVRFLNLGNEVDTYLAANPGETEAFVRFVDAGTAVLTDAAPDVATGVVFGFDSWRISDSVFRRLYPGVNQVSFTYYDANSQIPGTIQRGAADVPFDFADMLNAAGSKPLVLTETGYTSSADVGGGVDRQQDFYSAMFAQLAAAGNRAGGATFAFMSEFPPETIAALTIQYGAGSPWVSWLGGLGLFDRQGNPKPAWDVFTSSAPALKANTGCTAPQTAAPSARKSR